MRAEPLETEQLVSSRVLSGSAGRTFGTSGGEHMEEKSAAPLLLLVEDEALLRIETEDLLTDQGFEVIVSMNGSDGILELERGTDRFSAVVTDVGLGSGPNGWEVAHRARELAATMPVVYVTGGSANEWAANGVPGSILITKPFVPAQLITAIATLLNEPTALGMGETGSSGS
jgi:DNA-binding response OmpR family regulator